METTFSGITEFSDQRLQEMVVESVQKVFNTMLFRNVKFEERIVCQNTAIVTQFIDTAEVTVAASIGLTGKVNGVVYLYFPASLARAVASSMLGLSVKEVEDAGVEVVNDVVGEVANMVVGLFKNDICDLGYSCILTIPTVLRGNNLSVTPVDSGDVLRKLYLFDSEDIRFIFDVLFKLEG